MRGRIFRIDPDAPIEQSQRHMGNAELGRDHSRSVEGFEGLRLGPQNLLEKFQRLF